MSKKIPNIKDRVLYVADYLESNKQIFFRKTNLKYSNFTGKSKESDLQSRYIAEILLKYPEINPSWLLLGEGPILIKQKEELPNIVKEPKLNYGSDSSYLEKMIDRKDEELKECYQQIGKLKEQIKRLSETHPNPKYVLGED